MLEEGRILDRGASASNAIGGNLFGGASSGRLAER